MAAGVLMPKAGISVESCVITEWLKEPGDIVKVGDVLFSYETDKANFECESTEAGELLEIFYGNGDEVPVLVNVCAVGKSGEDVSGLRPQSAAAEQASTEIPEREIHDEQAVNQETVSVALSGDIKISPRARNLAAKQDINPLAASPSGPYGRIIERDIREVMEKGIGRATPAAYKEAASLGLDAGSGIGGRVAVADLNVGNTAVFRASITDGEAKLLPEYEDVAFTGIRRAISKSMTRSLSTIPQLTHNFSFDATEILAYREKLKKNGESMNLPNITMNDFILYAVSRLILKYPELNAHMPDDNTIRYYREVHLGMAVDTPKGLLVPVIRHANRKTLAQISTESKKLAKQAQEGTLSPDLMTGGTFTISNLGALNVESFTPVINPPQTGILGVDNIIERPRTVNGEIRLYPAMGISLTYDHRAIDGAPASRFASELCRALESFTLLLASN